MQPNFYLASHQWLVFDEDNNHQQADLYSPLAYQDAFIRYVPSLQKAHSRPTGLIHFYPIDTPSVLLGAKDTRLQAFEDAQAYLTERAYRSLVRPHGGLAVVADAGVLNFALVTDQDQYPLNIDQAFQESVKLVKEALRPLGLVVEAYEISDSYCPGKYDLVVDGQKIGGIAQRRFLQGVTTATYISVQGPQKDRADLMANFYRIGQADASYPRVRAEEMTSIEELINRPYQLADLRQALIQTLERHSQSLVQAGDYQASALQAIYHKTYPKTVQRSKRRKEN